jgi:hypothetical protein
MTQLNEAKLTEIGTYGTLLDANNPSVNIKFTSTRNDLSRRALDLIARINYCIRLADAGKDYKSDAFRKAHPNMYFPRYQTFIDAGTKDFQVRLTSTFNVTK